MAKRMKILITNPPLNCWANGYIISEGSNQNSLNKTTKYAKENNIKADQERLKNSFLNLKKTLVSLNFDVTVLDFPKDLITSNGEYHDGVFVRDVGFMYKDYWIQANFNVSYRQKEAFSYSKVIKEKFNKKIITLPQDAFIEFGEVYYLETKNGSFYFGGLSRANKKGHDLVRDIVKPDNYILLSSKGYHLDTVFTPVLNSNNELVAVIVAHEMFDKKSLELLKKLNVEILYIDKKDSSSDDGLGNYSVNCLVSPGILVSGSRFSTPFIHEKLEKLNINFYTVSLPDYNFSGGSVHCLTNELYI
jgi:N-dimethylarginine dimethylaminohydrolase